MNHPRLTMATHSRCRWVKSSTGWREWNGHDWVPSNPPPEDAVFEPYFKKRSVS